MLKKKRTDQSLAEELRRSNQQLTTLKKEHTELEFRYNRTRCREQELQEQLCEERIEKTELEKKMALIVGMRFGDDMKMKENELLKRQIDRTPRPASARLGSPPPPPPPKSNPSSPALRGSMRIPPPPPPPLSMSSSSSPLLSPTTPHPPSPPPSPVTPPSTRSAVPVPSHSSPVVPPNPESEESSSVPTPSSVPVPSHSSPAVPPSPAKCPIDPAYKKYFRLKKLHMPIENLKQKIENDGYDPTVIDQDEPEWDPEPEEPSSTVTPVQVKPQPPSEPEP